MADLNKGKFQGLDENAKNNYADSFIGATKVAEKVKKGGSETTSDGYVVDAIDIDWGGLKLTTISDNWSFGMQTVTSTEQNAGKGDNTQGIHSTAYLLNKIGDSFTQIYNQIGKNDTAEDSLRKRVKAVEDSISKMADLTPEELLKLQNNIEAINKELADPGATNALITILDTLDGFNKQTKGDVKKYIDKHDEAILGSTADAATSYTVYGVRKYVDTTAKDTLLGKDGDLWPTQHTIYGVANYANERAFSSYTDARIYTNQAIGTAESTLIGSTADTTINTHWGVKNSLIGKSTDATTADTIWGAKNYAEKLASSSYTDARIYTNQAIGTAESTLIGSTADATTADTIWGAKNYAKDRASSSYADAVIYTNKAIGTAESTLLGKDGDLWPTQHTVYGVAQYAEYLTSLSYTAVSDLEDRLIGNTADTTINSHWGVKNTLIGSASDASTDDTIWGAKNYAKNQISVKKYNQLTAQVIEEDNEGILELLTVSSYLG